MSKVRVYLKSEEIGVEVRLKDKELIHKLNTVLRLENGESVFAFDGQGSEYQYVLQSIGKREAVLKQQCVSKQEKNQRIKISVAFPLMQEERIEFLLQKATELGATDFLPFISQRSIQQNPSAMKTARWQKIILEAVRQSEQLWLPRLFEPAALPEILRSKAGKKIVASINGKKLAACDLAGCQDVLAVFGPVGDFSPDEYAAFQTAGFIPVNLSDQILRSETAGIFLVGLINYFLR